MLFKTVILVFLFIINNVAYGEIIETKNIATIKKHIANTDTDALILLDIDDTVITHKANMFRAHSKYRNLIDDIRKERKNLHNYEEIYSNWRLQRKVMLVENQWPSIIENAVTLDKKIYALTQIDGGKFGNISKVEDWRYQELMGLGISFNKLYNNKEELIFLEASNQDLKNIGYNSPTIFYKGFFLTGANSKADVVTKLIREKKPSKVVFIDDREDHVINVSEACKKLDIRYVGIIFKGKETIEGEVSDDLAIFQKSYLIKHATWLEDDEAQKMMSK